MQAFVSIRPKHEFGSVGRDATYTACGSSGLGRYHSLLFFSGLLDRRGLVDLLFIVVLISGDSRHLPSSDTAVALSLDICCCSCGYEDDLWERTVRAVVKHVVYLLLVFWCIVHFPPVQSTDI